MVDQRSRTARYVQMFAFEVIVADDQKTVTAAFDELHTALIGFAESHDRRLPTAVFTSGGPYFDGYDQDDPAEPRTCRVCNCTDDDCSGCVERTGGPCWWVAAELCSACVGKQPT